LVVKIHYHVPFIPIYPLLPEIDGGGRNSMGPQPGHNELPPLHFLQCIALSLPSVLLAENKNLRLFIA
jgi:hypothetical protein